MQAHGRTTTWETRLGVDTHVTGLDRLRRIQEWFARRTGRGRYATPGASYKRWDRRRGQFRPPTAEAALDHAAAQGGESWSITMYSTLL